MKKWLMVGFAFVTVLTSPIWFYSIKNEILAYQVEAFLTSVSLPDRAKIITSSRRVFNSGNGDGCDHQAFAIIEYYGRVAEMRASFSHLLQSYPKPNKTDTISEGSIESPLGWGIKVVGGGAEFHMRPNKDFAPYYLVYLTEYPRAVSPDFRCW